MKRLLVLSCSVLLAAGMISGCGSTDAGNIAPGSTYKDEELVPLSDYGYVPIQSASGVCLLVNAADGTVAYSPHTYYAAVQWNHDDEHPAYAMVFKGTDTTASTDSSDSDSEASDDTTTDSTTIACYDLYNSEGTLVARSFKSLSVGEEYTQIYDEQYEPFTIDDEGNFLTDSYTETVAHHGICSAYQDDGSLLVTDEDGNEILSSSDYSYATSFLACGYMVLTASDHTDIMNEKGKITETYDTAYQILTVHSNGHALAVSYDDDGNMTEAFLDLGKGTAKVLTGTASKFTELTNGGEVYVASAESGYTVNSYDGDILLTCDEVSAISENGLVTYSENDKYGVEDLEGNSVISAEYDSLYSTVPGSYWTAYREDDGYLAVIGRDGSEASDLTTSDWSYDTTIEGTGEFGNSAGNSAIYAARLLMEGDGDGYFNLLYPGMETFQKHSYYTEDVIKGYADDAKSYFTSNYGDDYSIQIVPVDFERLDSDALEQVNESLSIAGSTSTCDLGYIVTYEYLAVSDTAQAASWESSIVPLIRVDGQWYLWYGEY